MRRGASRRDQLLAYRDGKRQVRETIAVHVPELAPADAELDAAEAMRRDRHAFP